MSRDHFLVFIYPSKVDPNRAVKRVWSPLPTEVVHGLHVMRKQSDTAFKEAGIPSPSTTLDVSICPMRESLLPRFLPCPGKYTSVRSHSGDQVIHGYQSRPHPSHPCYEPLFEETIVTTSFGLSWLMLSGTRSFACVSMRRTSGTRS